MRGLPRNSPGASISDLSIAENPLGTFSSVRSLAALSEVLEVSGLA